MDDHHQRVQPLCVALLAGGQPTGPFVVLAEAAYPSARLGRADDFGAGVGVEPEPSPRGRTHDATQDVEVAADGGGDGCLPDRLSPRARRSLAAAMDLGVTWLSLVCSPS